MPLTSQGKKVLQGMIKHYKGKKKGKGVFYASTHKKKKGTSKWHKMDLRKQAAGELAKRYK